MGAGFCSVASSGSFEGEGINIGVGAVATVTSGVSGADVCCGSVGCAEQALKHNTAASRNGANGFFISHSSSGEYVKSFLSLWLRQLFDTGGYESVARSARLASGFA